MNFRMPARCAMRLAAAGFLGAAVVGLTVAAGAAQETKVAPSDPNTVVVTVNGTEITEGDVAIAVEDLAGVLRQVPPEQHGDYIVSFLVDVALVSREAEKEGFADNEDVKRQLVFDRNKALVQAKLRAVGEAAVNDDAVKARYEEAIKDYEPKEEVHARHILVKTEEEAKDIKAKIDAGASFEEMAKEHSTDGSSQNGGDLDYFTKEMMVEPFGNAAFSMEVGAVSDPVQTQFGWHLIKVEDKRMSAPPPLEDVRDDIARELAQTARRDYITGLREAAKIERKDEAGAAPAQQ